MSQLTLNSIIDHPVALKRLVPFPVHGAIEKWTGPTLFALVSLGGGLRKARNRNYLLAYAVSAFLIYNLTDWNARPRR